MSSEVFCRTSQEAEKHIKVGGYQACECTWSQLRRNLKMARYAYGCLRTVNTNGIHNSNDKSRLLNHCANTRSTFCEISGICWKANSWSIIITGQLADYTPQPDDSQTSQLADSKFLKITFRVIIYSKFAVKHFGEFTSRWIFQSASCLVCKLTSSWLDWTQISLSMNCQPSCC